MLKFGVAAGLGAFNFEGRPGELVSRDCPRRPLGGQGSRLLGTGFGFRMDKGSSGPKLNIEGRPGKQSEPRLPEASLG